MANAATFTGTVHIDGLRLKIGRFGKVFYQSGSEWYLSTRSPEEVSKAIAREAKSKAKKKRGKGNARNKR